MISIPYYICPFKDCREQVDPPDGTGLAYCERCEAWVEPEKVLDFDREDREIERLRQRGNSNL